MGLPGGLIRPAPQGRAVQPSELKSSRRDDPDEWRPVRRRRTCRKHHFPRSVECNCSVRGNRQADGFGSRPGTADDHDCCRQGIGGAITARALREANALYLEGDLTRREDAITRELERRGRSGAPLYLVCRPGRAEPEVLADGVVVEALK